VALAGYVIVEDRVIIGGLCGVQQFVRVGTLSITGGCSKLVQDVPPFVMVEGQRATVRGLNLVGLDRAGFSAEDKALLKHAYRILFRSDLLIKKALEKVEVEVEMSPPVIQLLKFLKTAERGITK